jgi:WD40 repeat protein
MSRLDFKWSLFLGYDVFISYKQSEAERYAVALHARLSQAGLECFLDREETPAGVELSTAIRRALRRSRFLVVIITPGALGSTWVRAEVEHFSKHDGRLIPISVGGALTSSSDTDGVREGLGKLAWLNESAQAVGAAEPSDAVVAGILLTRTGMRVRLQSGLIVLAVLASLLGVGIVAEKARRRSAVEAQNAADQRAVALKKDAESRIKSLIQESRADGVSLGRRIDLAREAWQRADGLDAELKVMGENALRGAVLAAGGEELRELEGFESARCTPWLSQNERWLVFVGNDKVWVADMDSEGSFPTIQTIELPASLDAGALSSAAIDNRGTRLAAWRWNQPGPVWIWDLTRAQERPKSVRVDGMTLGTPVLFSPDGRWLIAGRFVVDLNADPWRPVPGIHARHRPHAAVISEDGHRVVLVDSTEVFGLGQRSPFPCEVSEPAQRPACEKANRDLAEAERKRTSAQSGIVLDLSGDVPAELGHWQADPRDNERAVISRNGDWAVVWYHPTSFMPEGPSGSPVFLAALQHPQNGRLSTPDFGWDRVKERRRYDEIAWDLLQRGVVGVAAFSPDSRLLAMDLEGHLVVWKVPNVDDLLVKGTPQVAELLWQDDPDAPAVLALAFSEDGRWLAAGGQGVRLWNLKAPNPFASPSHTFRTGAQLVDRIAIDHTGRWLVAGRSRITLWDLSLSVPASAEIHLAPKFWDARPDDMLAKTQAGRSVFDNDFFLAPAGRRLVTVGNRSSLRCNVTNWNLDIQAVETTTMRLAKQN